MRSFESLSIFVIGTFVIMYCTESTPASTSNNIMLSCVFASFPLSKKGDFFLLSHSDCLRDYCLKPQLYIKGSLQSPTMTDK